MSSRNSGVRSTGTRGWAFPNGWRKDQGMHRGRAFFSSLLCHQPVSPSCLQSPKKEGPEKMKPSHFPSPERPGGHATVSPFLHKPRSPIVLSSRSRAPSLSSSRIDCGQYYSGVSAESCWGIAGGGRGHLLREGGGLSRASGFEAIRLSRLLPIRAQASI
jgi:hypothetical protein